MRCGYILTLLRKRSSKSSNFSDFPSNVGSDAVRAFGISSKELSFYSAPKSVLTTAGRFLDAGWLWDLIFGLFGWFVESVRTPVTMLRLQDGSLF